MEQRERLIEEGFIPVDLKSGNVKVGDRITNDNMIFGELVSITNLGNYMVRFDMDYMGEKPTRFEAEIFEKFFLVDKRKSKKVT